MTPRFASLFSALFIAFMIMVYPDEVKRVWGKIYAAVMGHRPPADEAWVEYAPTVLIIGVILVVAIMLVNYTQRSYGEFKDGRRRSHGEVIQDAKRVAEANEGQDPESPFISHDDWRHRS